MASLTDFASTIESDPHLASAWGDVQTQILHENGFDPSSLLAQAKAKVGDSVSAQAQAITTMLQAKGGATYNTAITQLNGAKGKLTDAYQQLTEQGFNLSGTDPVEAAKSLVMTGMTIAGAVGTVANMVSTAASGSPSQITQAFTGSMIGIMGMAGAVSAGVGAAICGAIAMVTGILEQAHLMGGSPVPQYDFMWPGSNIGFQVDKTHGAPITITPGSPVWRTFPSPTDPIDATWFRVTGVLPGIAAAACLQEKPWRGLYTGTIGDTPCGIRYGGKTRAIDAWFYPYPELEKATDDFKKTYFSAWKSNFEYVFNGLKSQSDSDVLVHVIRIWNASHERGNPTVLSQGSGPSYLNTLVTKALANMGGLDEYIQGGNSILVYRGAQKNMTIAPSVAVSAHRTIALHIGKLIQNPIPASHTALPVTLPALKPPPPKPVVLITPPQQALSSTQAFEYAALGGAIGMITGPVGAVAGAAGGYLLGQLKRK